jgi:hypothetical protein
MAKSRKPKPHQPPKPVRPPTRKRSSKQPRKRFETSVPAIMLPRTNAKSSAGVELEDDAEHLDDRKSAIASMLRALADEVEKLRGGNRDDK